MATSLRLSGGKVYSSVFNIMKRYEDIIGLTAVHESQQKVIEAEEKFASCQEKRRTKQEEIQNVHMQLKEIHADLDKTSRGEDRYLNLLTQEHAVIKREKILLDDFKLLERDEREQFHRLSHFLRDSHEKERERGERTKYWSIIGSAVGALIGILGTTVNNRLRMRELRNLVQESTDTSKVQQIIHDLSCAIETQQTQVHNFVMDLRQMFQGRDLSGIVPPKSDLSAIDFSRIMAQSDTVISELRTHERKLDDDLHELKKMIAIEKGFEMENDGTIIYVGPEVQSLLDQTEKNLEWKLKISTLVNVVMVYGAIAVTLPIVYFLLKGN